MKTIEEPFWETKSLDEMTEDEWESLCDGCARCCLHKVEDENSGQVYYTYISCKLLNTDDCQCKAYDKRFDLISDCLKIKPTGFTRMHILPETCAYRTLYEGRKLEWWHPLISNDQNSVHQANISVRDKVIPEDNIHPDDIQNCMFFMIE